MGLFSKLSQVLGGKTATKEPDTELQSTLAELRKDGRLHARYSLSDHIATLSLDGGLTGPIKDVSYGGIAACLKTPGSELPQTLPPSLKARLTLLDQAIDLQLTTVRFLTQGGDVLLAGFAINHETPATLLFLRELIEPLRRGQTLMSLAPEMRNERYKGSEWTCLRGEGPTDLILKSLPDGGLDEALLTFRMQEAYCELSVRQGVLRTGRTVDRPEETPVFAVGGRVTSSAQVEKMVLRQAVYVLASALSNGHKLVEPLLRQVLAELKVAQSQVAKPA